VTLNEGRALEPVCFVRERSDTFVVSKEESTPMIKRLANPGCITAFFDSVFAVALAMVVASLKAQHEAAFGSLAELSLPATMFVLAHVMYIVLYAKDVDGLYLEDFDLKDEEAAHQVDCDCHGLRRRSVDLFLCVLSSRSWFEAYLNTTTNAHGTSRDVSLASQIS
jgi:hypothetical protein